jgi:hypothetical protein
MTKLPHLVEALLLLVFTGIVLNLNVSVVLKTTSDGWLDDRCTLDLAESVGRSKGFRKNCQQIIDMSRASPLSTSPRFLRKGNLDTVQVPVEATEATWDDHAIGSRSLPIAAMAENNLALSILLTEVIRCFFPASFVVPGVQSASNRCINQDRGGLLWLRGGGFLVLAICTRLDIHKVLPDRLGQAEGSWILICELRDQWAPNSTGVVMKRTIFLESAIVAEPIFWKRIEALADGRINTLEVE